MANGDDAADAGMAVLDGTEDRRLGYDEINKTRDYIAQRTSTVTPISKGGTGQTTVAAARNALGLGNTAGAVPIANGGTGSTTAANARSALGITPATIGAAPTSHTHSWSQITGEPSTYPPSSHTHPASQITSGTLDSARIPNLPASKITSGTLDDDRIPNLDASKIASGTISRPVSTSGDVYAGGNLRTAGRVLAPGSRGFSVSVDYASAYLDGNGWMGITPSAERFKQDIASHAYTLEQLLLIQVVAYRLKSAVESNPEASGEVGVIAEQLIAAGLPEFVIFNAAGETQSVAYERLVLVTIGAMQDMAGRVASIEARLSALEGQS